MHPDLLRYVLPSEIVDYFDLVDLQTCGNTLHFHLDELSTVPDEYKDLSLSPNGFYEASTVKDFPLRDKKVVLHLRRRRWIDGAGKSYWLRRTLFPANGIWLPKGHAIRKSLRFF